MKEKLPTPWWRGRRTAFFLGLALGAALVSGVMTIASIAGVTAAADSAVACMDETRFINFDLGSTRRDVLVSGWGRIQRKGGPKDSVVWCEARVCSLKVRSRGDGDRIIRARWAPFRYPEAPVQSVSLYVNDVAVAVQAVPSGFTVAEFRAKQAVWRPGDNSIRFEFAHADVPRQVTAHNADKRTLSVAFDWIEIIRR